MNDLMDGQISLYNVLKAISSAIDLISTTVVGHHQQTTYIAYMIAKEMGLSNKKIRELLLAALLHDIGVFYLNQNFNDLKFDVKDNLHAEVGYQILKKSILLPNRWCKIW